MLESQKDRYPDHYRETTSLPRVNITPAARNIHATGFKRLQNDPISPERHFLGLSWKKPFNPTPEEAIEIYHQGKAERYALTSIIASRVIDRAIAQRSKREPYGLVGLPIDPETWEENLEVGLQVIEWIALPEPFRLLDIYMHRTLAFAWACEMYTLDKLSKENPKDTISQAYKRLKQWEGFYHEFLPLTSRGTIDLGEDTVVTYNPVFTEITTGIGTATRLMASLLRIVPKVCERELPYQEITPELLTDVAKNSFPFIAKNAMTGLDLQKVIHDVLSNEAFTSRYPFDNHAYHPYFQGRLDPLYFALKKGSQGYRLDMHEGVERQAEYHMAQFKGSGQKYTVGCPAMVNVDETGSSVQKLWDWHVDIGKKLYHDLWDPWFIPAAAKQARFDAIKQWAEKRGLRAAGIHF